MASGTVDDATESLGEPRAGRALSVTKDLRGMEVRRHETDEVIGTVDDVLVHPTEGCVVALWVATNDDARRVVDVADFEIREGFVVARPYSAAGGNAIREALLRGVRAAKRLLGMEIVSDLRNALGYLRGRGEHVGYVRDVFVLPDDGTVAYRVGGVSVGREGFFLAGSVPCAYSKHDGRIEVPRGAEVRFAAASPAEAAELASEEAAA